jgi:hypothetical protein
MDAGGKGGGCEIPLDFRKKSELRKEGNIQNINNTSMIESIIKNYFPILNALQLSVKTVLNCFKVSL